MRKVVYSILHLLYTMLYQKEAEKAVQIGLHCRPTYSASSDEDSDATGRSATSSSSSGDPPTPSPPSTWGVWGSSARSWLWMGGSHAMQVGTERSIVHASQLAEGHVKELDCPSLWFVLGPKEGSNLGPKEGSNCDEGREVRDEVRGHNWHRDFRHFHPDFNS